MAVEAPRVIESMEKTADPRAWYCSCSIGADWPGLNIKPVARTMKKMERWWGEIESKG